MCHYIFSQIKSARIPIFSDLTIEILTLTFPTRWQERAVMHLIFYFITHTIKFVQNVIKLFSIKFHNRNHLSQLCNALHFFIQTRIGENILLRTSVCYATIITYRLFIFNPIIDIFRYFSAIILFRPYLFSIINNAFTRCIQFHICTSIKFIIVSFTAAA